MAKLRLGSLSDMSDCGCHLLCVRQICILWTLPIPRIHSPTKLSFPFSSGMHGSERPPAAAGRALRGACPVSRVAGRTGHAATSSGSGGAGSGRLSDITSSESGGPHAGFERSKLWLWVKTQSLKLPGRLTSQVVSILFSLGGQICTQCSGMFVPL